MYVIFYNNKPIYLSDNASNCTNLKSFDFNNIDIFDLLNQLKKDHLKGFCLIDDNITALFQNVIKNFKVIEAAGGLVFNDVKELLFIFRNGKWDLPKGKVEKGESVSQTALREVTEECGVNNLKLDSFFDKTYHIYELNNRFIFKITHWFKMTSTQKITLVPQLEEGITKAVFLNNEAQKEALKNTYPNIKLLIENFKK